MSPVITIIVPVYNICAYIGECIDSILAQTFTDYELILVDDGSTDGSGAICDEYALKDARIRVIHCENRGVSAARNTALDEAQGEYIAFIDGDDLVSRHYLSVLYDALTRNNCDLSYCRFLRFDDGAAFEEDIDCDHAEEKLMSGRDVCLSDDRTLNFNSVWGRLIHRSLLESVRFPEDITCGEDLVVSAKVMYNCDRAAFVDCSLYFYRNREGSAVNSSFLENEYETMRAYECCLEYFRARKDPVLVEKYEKTITFFVASDFLTAKSEGKLSVVPEKYRCGEIKAWKMLKKTVDNNSFNWFLGKYHPFIRPLYSFAMRIKFIAHAALKRLTKLIIKKSVAE